MWQADPLDEDTVKIGDVGYIRFGKLKFLFNTEDEVPSSSYTLETRHLDAPRPLQSASIRSVEIEVGASAEPVGPLGSAQAEIGYKCSKSHGAILALIDKFAHGEDCDLKGKKLLGECMLKNYKRWLQKYPELECRDLVLITGYHLTRDWEAILFSSSNRSISGTLGASVPLMVSAHANWISRMTQETLNFSSGHHHRVTPTTKPCCDPIKQNQSIFLRGWRLRERIILPPKLKAAAGYDQLPDPDRDHTDTPEQVAELEHFPNEPEQTSNIYDKIFDHLFLHCDADVAMVHDDDVIATLKTQKSSKFDVLSSSALFTSASIRLSSRDVSFLSHFKTLTAEVASLTSMSLWQDSTEISGKSRAQASLEQTLSPSPPASIPGEVLRLRRAGSPGTGSVTPKVMSLGLRPSEDHIQMIIADYKRHIKTTIGPPLALLPTAAFRLLTKPTLLSAVYEAYTNPNHKTYIITDPMEMLQKHVSSVDHWLEEHVGESSSDAGDTPMKVYMITGFHVFCDRTVSKLGWLTGRSAELFGWDTSDDMERIIMVQYREVKRAQRGWFPFWSQSTRWVLDSAARWTSVSLPERGESYQGMTHPLDIHIREDRAWSMTNQPVEDFIL